MATQGISKPKLLITCPEILEDVVKQLEQTFKLTICPQKIPTRAEIIQNLSDFDALWWHTKERLDKEILDLIGPKLKVVATTSAGYDHIDLKEIKSRGIRLGNVPYIQDKCVSEVAVGLMLAAAHRFPEGLEAIKRDEWRPWRPQWLLGQEITDSTVGIVGLGGIGQCIAKRVLSFEAAQILYTGHAPKEAAKCFGAQFVTLDELLQRSDFIILSCPLTEETKHLINDEAFSKMKSNAILVNISRGGVVDQEALIRALKSKRIFAAGLDVMTPEPLPIDSPLLELSNIVLAPHIGSASYRTRRAMMEHTAANLICGIQGKPMASEVI